MAEILVSHSHIILKSSLFGYLPAGPTQLRSKGKIMVRERPALGKRQLLALGWRSRSWMPGQALLVLEGGGAGKWAPIFIVIKKNFFIEMKFIMYAIHHFKVCSSEAFSVFVMLCDHHLCPVSWHFQHPKGKSCSHGAVCPHEPHSSPRPSSLAPDDR